MNSKRVLIIEDEEPIADLLRYGLRQEGYEVEVCSNGSCVIKEIKNFSPSILLLDWMLPDCSGVDLCKMITNTYNIPIIMLTARDSMQDKILGLESGADDYITKPFEMCEVVARIETILRRIKKVEDREVKREDNSKIILGDISIDLKARSIYKNYIVIDTTPKEFELLVFLLENPNIVFSRETLLEKIWSYDFLGDTRTVDTHIQRLRKKFNLYDSLQTVFRIGYKYVKN